MSKDVDNLITSQDLAERLGLFIYKYRKVVRRMYELIQYRCRECNKNFFLFESEVEHNERESRFITCPYHGRHSDIIVTGRYGSLKEIRECMENKDIYIRKNGRIVRKDTIH